MVEQVIRTAYFEADLSDLIIEAAYPALQTLRDRSSAPGFLRTHWARGPHLDCVIAADEAEHGTGLLEEARDSIEQWVVRHPSGGALPADFLAQSQRMADAEQWRGAISPFYENNSVFLTANDRAALWSSARLGRAAAHFHSDVLPDVVQLIRDKRQSRGAFVLGAARRLAVVGRVASGPEFDFWPLSLSAHARLFLAAHPSMRTTFESAWARLRETAIREVGELIASSEIPADLANWTAAAKALNARLEILQADPDEKIVPMEVNNPLHIRDSLGSDEQVASRLSEMFDADRIAAAFESPLHHRFRIIVNLFYESLATATISPVERALACYILTRVILEDHPGVASAARENIAVLAGASNV
jgi:hypothetical protein